VESNAAIDYTDPENIETVDPGFWAYRNFLVLTGKTPFTFIGHEYQKAILSCKFPKQCIKKGAQLGVTEIGVIKSLHGHRFKRYPQGSLYLFPTQDDVTDFSKARFGPLIKDNPEAIGRFVMDTDAANIKRIGDSMLYFRGARAAKKIEGIKKTSSKLKSIPVDRITRDERDEMDVAMVKLSEARIDHSLVREELDLSTPSIPDYGIDKEYLKSDQRIWIITCKKCTGETCLEIEFPDIIGINKAGEYFRQCRHCGEEIHPRDGRWIAQYPSKSKDYVGWWISQLNQVRKPLAKIMETFLDTGPDADITEFYNSVLGMAHIEAENRLTRDEVYQLCSRDPMQLRSDGPCAMGVDVGKMLHVVVGFRKSQDTLKVIYVQRVQSFDEVHDIAKRYNVTCAVIDLYPETRTVREFQEAEPYLVYGCEYKENQPRGPIWTEPAGATENQKHRIVTINRTEICDTTHNLVVIPGYCILPRRNAEMDEFVVEMCNTAKVLETDEITGKQVYRYRKLDADHYRHAANYFWLASQHINIATETVNRRKKAPRRRDARVV